MPHQLIKVFFHHPKYPQVCQAGAPGLLKLRKPTSYSSSNQIHIMKLPSGRWNTKKVIHICLPRLCFVLLQCLTSELPEQQQQQQLLAAAALSAAAQSLQCWHAATLAAASPVQASSADRLVRQLAPYLQLLLAPEDTSAAAAAAAGSAAAASRSRTGTPGLSWVDAQLVFGSLGWNHWSALKKVQQTEPLQAVLLLLLVKVRGQEWRARAAVVFTAADTPVKRLVQHGSDLILNVLSCCLALRVRAASEQRGCC
jgi:hypothetical protein